LNEAAAIQTSWWWLEVTQNKNFKKNSRAGIRSMAFEQQS
jgi:hypothetical protein